MTDALTSSVTYVSAGIACPISRAMSATAAISRGCPADEIRGPGGANAIRRGTIATRIEVPVTRPKSVSQTFPRPAAIQP